MLVAPRRDSAASAHMTSRLGRRLVIESLEKANNLILSLEPSTAV